MTQTQAQTETLQTLVRETIEEADRLYTLMIEAGEHPNLDSVGYTSQIMLESFRDLLERPDLSMEELETLLRGARARVRAQIGPRPYHAPHETMGQRSAHRAPYVRVPKPVQAPDPQQQDRWADLMARIVVARGNEDFPAEDLGGSIEHKKRLWG